MPINPGSEGKDSSIPRSTLECLHANSPVDKAAHFPLQWLLYNNHRQHHRGSQRLRRCILFSLKCRPPLLLTGFINVLTAILWGRNARSAHPPGVPDGSVFRNDWHCNLPLRRQFVISHKLQHTKVKGLVKNNREGFQGLSQGC